MFSGQTVIGRALVIGCQLSLISIWLQLQVEHTIMKLSKKPKPTKGSAAANATEAHMPKVGGSVLPAFAVAVSCRSSFKAFMNSSLHIFKVAGRVYRTAVDTNLPAKQRGRSQKHYLSSCCRGASVSASRNSLSAYSLGTRCASLPRACKSTARC